MKLYYTPGACSLSPHIVARELGIPLDLIRVDLRAKKTEAGDDYLKINPKGQIPLLVLDSGETLTEGPAIVQYFADKKPDAGITGKAGTMARYHVIEWLNYVGTELHKSFAPLFNPATPDAYKPVVVANINAKLGFLDRHFATSNHLAGDAFTAADGYAFTVINWCNKVGIDLTPYPHVQAFVARVGARPKVREALQAEGLL